MVDYNPGGTPADSTQSATVRIPETYYTPSPKGGTTTTYVQKNANAWAQNEWEKNKKTIVAIVKATTPSQYWHGETTALSKWNEAVKTAREKQDAGYTSVFDPYSILGSKGSSDSTTSGGGGAGASGPTPQELAQQRRQFRAEIKKAADAYGIGLSRKQVARLAEIQQKKNLSATEVTNRLLKHLEMPASGDLSGQAGTVQDELGTWAKANGIDLNNNQIVNYAKKVIKGSTNIDGIKADIRKTYMAGAYPAWADRIAQGEDIADIAAPYVSAASKLLETDNLSLSDPLVKQGLQSVGQDGKPRVMPLYEYERAVRKDPRWQYTDNAKNTYYNAVMSIGRSFGMV